MPQQEAGTSRIVGVAGFEPATPCSQSRCANRTALHPEISGSMSNIYGDRCDPPDPNRDALTGLRYTPSPGLFIIASEHAQEHFRSLFIFFIKLFIELGIDLALIKNLLH